MCPECYFDHSPSEPIYRVRGEQVFEQLKVEASKFSPFGIVEIAVNKAFMVRINKLSITPTVN